MRKLVVFSLLLATVSLFAVPLNIDYSLETEYSENIWHLSDYDIERAEEGSDSLPFVETIDDLVVKSSVRAKTSFKLKKHVSIDPFVKLSYNYYTSNSDKTKSSILSGINAMYKPFYLTVEYGFNPGNYLRDYKDDKNHLYNGTGEYEMFEYDKNQYRVKLSWQALKKHRFFAEGKMEELFHNEYFTEYDGVATTYKAGWRGSFPGVYLNFAYSFKEFVTEDDIQALYTDDIDWDTIPSDSSYESDIYEFGITLKKIDTSWDDVKYRFTVDFDLEKRYYQGSDDYHYKREDTKTTVSPSLVFYLGKAIDIHLDYSYCNRTVESPYNSVPKYKEYLDNTLSLGFGYKFDLFE